MVWAIDLDDGSMIAGLGANIARPKPTIINMTMVDIPDYETLLKGIDISEIGQ